MSRSHRSVQCFGLWGMGGVGKTTTAKSIYNRMHKGFESSAFILDTRANAALSSSGLLNLQQKILDNLMPKESQGSNINDVDHGKRVLSSKLKGFNAFIVLDDLDKESQIEALCFPLSSLDPKSIVIITSRDRRILTHASIKEENIFPIQELSEGNSEWLFCWHAFMSPVPPAHLTEVSKEVIRACQGLPLSLKVLGSHLYGVRDINAWKESLTLIKQDENDIFSILRVSLNRLNSSDKEAFLDICCFFIGREEDFVCAFLEGCYERSTTILITLKSKCLITVKSAIEYDWYDGRSREVRRLQVHDQLRDMGRDIIQKEEKNRAWDEKTSNDILKDAKAISGLRDLSARTDMQYPRILANYNWFPHLRFLELEDPRIVANYNWYPHLRFIELEEAQETGQMNERMTLYNVFANAHCDELRWLTWRLPQELPPGLCSKQLRVLLLSNNGVRKLPGPLPNLRILEIQGCHGLEAFSTAIGTSPLLQRLKLTNCARLMSLDPSIGRLTDLRSLTIAMCTSMTHLSFEMRNLRSLRELTLKSLQHMKTLSLPPNLRTLRLESCDSLESVDGSLSNLEELKLGYCRKLTRFRVLGSSLVGLAIELCPELLLDDDECLKWKDLRSLRELTLKSLQHMKTLSLPPNLRTLTLESCDSLESVDGSLPNLEELQLFYCGKLKRFPVLGSSLVRLTIDRCRKLLLDDDECLKWKGSD
ncbi:hypothetical protein KP509_33G004700 [Ceratopteris richardii]|uniref:NB-ARC domain-containing protein n=1 Tax=Ceratopteris richardii TaxID=49495 RepID=A0A8T2QN91_CERRI|nr:hypothetical protein KP509_33G004700 [Ceratopteris richardii]